MGGQRRAIARQWSKEVITSDNAIETSVHQFAAGASDLRFPVGEWPTQLPTSLGNRLPFLLTKIDKDVEGDVRYAVYYQCNGCIELTVFND
jgi:hypothetical protein